MNASSIIYSYLDIEDPVFTYCPSMVLVGTESGLNSAKVTWKLPEVTDNSGRAQTVIQTDKPSGSRFDAGIYNVKYSAKDDAGNWVDSERRCFFNVQVKRKHRTFNINR
jgi:hypothetical protein